MGPTKPDAVGETMVKEKKGGFDLGMFDIKQSKDKPEGELNIKDKAEGELPPELEMAMKSSVGNVMVAGNERGWEASWSSIGYGHHGQGWQESFGQTQVR